MALSPKTTLGPRADHGARQDVTQAIDGRQHAEGHAVLRSLNQFAAKGVFERLLHGHLDAAEHEGQGACVMEEDDITQCLLEVFAAVELSARHNSFRTT